MVIVTGRMANEGNNVRKYFVEKLFTSCFYSVQIWYYNVISNLDLITYWCLNSNIIITYIPYNWYGIEILLRRKRKNETTKLCATQRNNSANVQKKHHRDNKRAASRSICIE